MAFPMETAMQIRRRVVDICQDQTRKVLEAVRELPIIFTLYKKGDVKELNEHCTRVVVMEEEAASLKRALMTELTEAGALLLSREDFLRLAATCSEIADYAGGIAFRVSEIINRKWKVDKDMVDDLTKLSEASLTSVTKLRETIYSLSFNAEKTGELAKGVEAAENIVDSLYRKLDLKIVESDMKIPVILILRDVANFLEGIADLAEDAADAARILSLSAF